MKRLWTRIMLFCRSFLQAVAEKFYIEITDEKWSVCEQFIKFILVGCSNAAVSLATYYIIIIICGHQTYLIGQTIGYIVGIVNSFFWNKKFVFSDTKQRSSYLFVKMCMCYGVTYFLQIGVLYILVEFCRVSTFLSPLIAIIITTPINFLLNRSWAFRK